MYLNKKSKNINLIFRLCIIACAVFTAIGMVKGVSYLMKINDMSYEEAFFTEQFSKFMTSMRMYMFIFVGTLVCTVLSIAAWKTEHYAKVIVRTICFIILAITLFRGFSAAKTITEAGKLIAEFNITDIEDLTDEIIESSEYTKEEIEEIADSLDNFEEDDLVALLIGYVNAAVLYIIFFITSIVSLIKIQCLYMIAGDPTNSPEYFAAMAMNNQNSMQGANVYGSDMDMSYAPINSNFANNGNYNGFGDAPVDNGYAGQPMNNGFNNAPMNNGYNSAPMNNGFNDPQMNGGFGNAPMNNSGMGTMEDHFNVMNQNGGYNNGNFSNQGYTGSGLPDDLDDDDL